MYVLEERDMTSKNYRSLFISDLHMGTADCKAEYLLDLIESTQAEHIYLVGDVFDLWAMPLRMSWNANQSAVIKALLDKASAGTDVVYIPGNHDAALRRFCGSEFHGVRIERFAEHVMADGRRMKVTHGDEFDGHMRFNEPLKKFGDSAYSVLLGFNRACNKLRTRIGRHYWSLSGFIKSRLGHAQKYVCQYEEIVARSAGEEGYDGVICGHIHQAAIRTIDGIEYFNDGDWVEHCTCLLEEQDGSMVLMHWSEKQVELGRMPVRTAENVTYLQRVA
jgi:UDP-2,3-diacylglucosamine pyrophosphatase LpxH